ncbi:MULTISPECIES: ring-cleaving dioxygenase [Bacillus]|uniref:ring-cleaving dioxygenase n=1 Tax=Bacillus TaxID=1386 RepID=UPI00066FF5D2|nr:MULTISPECIES: ring-cleaving dioxygenase [Bacillus]MED0772262.1 ring-cleaving dioxygenase [Bacillus siamensis]MED0777449.1 ring-cleaving dioxygenase [Bacillus siamensis]MED0781027.1 ring-cleaving dioxygenase [Bacillus siamensis]MED0835878.1 ring-cleaving dioxygenase [Bacillus siamensis]
MNTQGLHHVTAFAKDPAENLRFYTEVLGLRLVKKTVNFDDPATYHFYFGNQNGEPGTIITFFPFQGSRPGTVGKGQAGRIYFSVPKGALAFWKRRLEENGIPVKEQTMLSEQVLLFDDTEDLPLAIMEDERSGQSEWTPAGITEKEAITGMRGVLLYSYRPEATIQFLMERFGYSKTGEENQIVRLQSEARIGHIIDVDLAPKEAGVGGYGTVHHVAFRTTKKEQAEWKNILADSHLASSDILDRSYFTSIYFRESGGILFEMATDEPGFMTDESFENLGTELKLPEWLEEHRGQITAILPKMEKGE